MDAVVRGLAILHPARHHAPVPPPGTLRQCPPFDPEIALAISEITQQAMMGDDLSITIAVLLVLTLFTNTIGVS
ncbi:hypothetical protein [Rhizobium sp. 2MFCol3.1]|uniref:hypothetical protein n=1 Tax=Rhizobium sp. 2MFCol3.1 TaxID=1246459 RepID=UPI00037CAA22|nr:hypothetical protein [Rhizobium sp. 2MFCol3.1]